MLSIMTLPTNGSDWGSMNPDFSFSHDHNSPLRGIECGKRDQYPQNITEMVFSPEKPENIHTMHFVINPVEETDDTPSDPILSHIRANLNLLPKWMVTDPLGDIHYIYISRSFSHVIYYTISDNIVTISRKCPVYPADSVCSDFDVALLLDHRPSFIEATYLLSFSPIDTMMILGGRYDVVGKFFWYRKDFWEQVKSHILDIVDEEERMRHLETRLFEYAYQHLYKV